MANMSSDTVNRRIHFGKQTEPVQNINHEHSETDSRRNLDKTPSLWDFFLMETRCSYDTESEVDRTFTRYEKFSSYIKIPRQVENFIYFGFLLCLDSFLFVFTYLPLRILILIGAVIKRLFSKCFRNNPNSSISNNRFLTSSELYDFIKLIIIIPIATIMLLSFDPNVLYHMIKSQSIVKLYIFYNMLEVADRLVTSFGQDRFDVLFVATSGTEHVKLKDIRLIPSVVVTIVYVFIHSFLFLCQITTLNVAINSNNKSLLTIMISNNFVELKGSVFKKFDRNTLFQVLCSDVRERFHLLVHLSLVTVLTMKEYSWKSESLVVLMTQCVILFSAEIFVDWVKHAFISRFNETIVAEVYRDCTTSLAYDIITTPTPSTTHISNSTTNTNPKKECFHLRSESVSRRLGFIPLPLGVVALRILINLIQINDLASVILLSLFILWLFLLKILIGILVLGQACTLISCHENITTQNVPSRSESPNFVLSKFRTTDCATSPFKLYSETGPNETETQNLINLNDDLVATAIFDNSAVDLNEAHLNEELLLNSSQLGSNNNNCDNVTTTRSVPDINNTSLFGVDSPATESGADIVGVGIKKAESDPYINN